MPAINPAQLRIKVASLRGKAHHTQQFVKSLHDLFSFYANRVQQPSQSGMPAPAIDAYHVPPQVLRVLKKELQEIPEQQPEIGLALIDALWDEEWLEMRRLATMLLGHISPARSEEVVDRVRSWTADCRETVLIETALDRGLSMVRKENKAVYYAFVDEISTRAAENRDKILLSALKPLVEEGPIEEIPVVLKYLRTLLQSESDEYLSELSEIIRQVAKGSEKEILFFLQHQVPTAPRPKINRVIRRSLPAFSPSSQTTLKEAIQEK